MLGSALGSTLACGVGMPSLGDLMLYILMFGAFMLAIVLALRSASKSLGHMAQLRPTFGYKAAHVGMTIAYGLSIMATVGYALLFMMFALH